MKKFLYIIIAALLLISCDVMKNVKKSESITDLSETSKSSIKRAGDSVFWKNTYHVKDTTIYTVNRQGTTLRTVIDKSGNVASVDCYASAIEILTEQTRVLTEALKTKDKVETVEPNTTWILYGFGAISLVIGAALFLMYKILNKNAVIVSELSKKML